jgi:DNA-binding XRE family transcriptional regulator
MGAALALWPNAHRERQLAELLAEHPCTMAGAARELTESVNDAEHILARLRSNGLPVAMLNADDEDPLYRVLYPAGRVCAAEGCGTILRRSNPADTCELHGGGFLTVSQRPPARPEAARVDWRGLRDLWGLSQSEWARRAKVNAGYLSCIERGLQHPSQEVARRLFHALPMRR